MAPILKQKIWLKKFYFLAQKRDSSEFFVVDGFWQNCFRCRVLALASIAAKRIGLQTKTWRRLPPVQA